MAPVVAAVGIRNRGTPPRVWSGSVGVACAMAGLDNVRPTQAESSHAFGIRVTGPPSSLVSLPENTPSALSNFA